MVMQWASAVPATAAGVGAVQPHRQGRADARRRLLLPHVAEADRLLREWLPDQAGTRSLEQWLVSPGVRGCHGDDPGRHAVDIVPARWAAVAGHHWPGGLGTGHAPAALSRRHLFDLAAARVEGSWIPLLFATYAWGHGTSGYGPARLRKILENNDLTDIDRSLDDAVDALRTDGAAAAYGVLNRRVRYLGPAFFTKFLYAAGEGLGVDGPRPLILDQRVAASLRALTTTLNRSANLSPDLPAWLWTNSGWSLHRYDQYVTFAHRLSRHLHGTVDGWPDRADLIELALFDKHLRDRLWGADT